MGLIETTRLKQVALDHGFMSVGVTSAEPIPEAIAAYRSWIQAGFHGEMAYMANHEPVKADAQNLLPGAKSAVVLTANYNQPPSKDPKIARYALGRDYHKVLKRMAQSVIRDIQGEHEGHEWRVCVDSIPILERAYANLAGIGWFGKNTMIIDSKRGSWFFLVVILTTVEFQHDAPAIGGCGNCHACIDACPTGAIVQLDGRWQVDARRCISYQTIEKDGELEVDTAGWVFGCDICQEVCPFNTERPSQPLRAQLTTISDFRRREIPTAERLAEIGWDEWDEITRGSAVRRAGYQGLKRNALAVAQSKQIE